MKDETCSANFILYLMFPFAIVANYRLKRNFASVDLQKSRNAWKVKEILRKTLQEPYQFKTNYPSGETVFYKTWWLYQRVLLAIVATFSVDPLVRISLMTLIVFIICVFYFTIKPYKPKMYILHWMEVFSVLGILVRFGHNMFLAFLNVYGTNYDNAATVFLQGFTMLDLITSPICVIFYFFIVKIIYNKAQCKIKSIYYTLRRRGRPI